VPVQECNNLRLREQSIKEIAAYRQTIVPPARFNSQQERAVEMFSTQKSGLGGKAAQVAHLALLQGEESKKHCRDKEQCEDACGDPEVSDVPGRLTPRLGFGVGAALLFLQQRLLFRVLLLDACAQKFFSAGMLERHTVASFQLARL
jgi:tryptophan 2,3-dioxygenase